jgi:hypothetical protein
LPSPPIQDLHSHPSTEQLGLLPSTDRETPQPLPSTQQPVYVTVKDSLSSDFYVFGQKVQNINKKACRQMFQALEPFRKDVVVDEPRKDSATAVKKFFSCYQKYEHKEPLKYLGVSGVTVEEFWKDGDKDYKEFEYRKLLIAKQAHTKLSWTMRRLHKWYHLACVCGLQFIECHIPKIVFKSQSFDINVKLFKLHTIFGLKMVDITMMTIFCM